MVKEFKTDKSELYYTIRFISLLIVILIFLFIFAYKVIGDNVNVNLKNANGTLTIGVNNITNTYSCVTDFINTIQVPITCGDVKPEQLISCNESFVRSVLSTQLDTEFNDQQSYFQQTVLPSEQSLKGNQSEAVNYKGRYESLQQQYDFLNQTHIPFLDSQVDSLIDERIYWVLGTLVMFFIVIIFGANQMGLFRRGGELLQKYTK